jgi:tetratricopeptide (TPR) repeat protein
LRTATTSRPAVRLVEPSVSDVAAGLSRVAVRGQALFWPVATVVLLVVLAGANGGYYPTTWNWAALIVAWAAAVVLLTRDAVTLSRLELVTIGALFALTGWVALSALWTDSLPSTVLEVERDVLYPVCVLAAAAAFGRNSSRRLLGAVCVAITLVSWYGLATRLFPDRVGTFDPISGYRLLRPIGYWNALGLYAAMGVLLALAFATRGRHLITRLLAASSIVLLATTLYFTYSRGAWIALGIGLGVAIALDTRRLQLITTALVLAPAPTVAVLVASRLRGLTHTDSALTSATHDGHRLALLLVALAAAAAALRWAQDRIETGVSVGPRIRRAYAAALILALAAALSLVVARYGSPEAIARKGWDQFTALAPKSGGTNLNARLFSLSSSGRTILWHHAWRDAQAHPVLGSGAGTYEVWYLRHRTDSSKVRDAHSLYAEVLAEVGPIGLALLLVALLTPLVAAVRARRQPLTAIAAGAYVAFVVHAGVDWDWELTAVTLAGLLCGVALLIGARGVEDRFRVVRARYALGGLTVAVGAVAIVGLLGNIPASNAGEAISAGNWSRAAAEARKEMRWAPWSADGWRRLGQAELAQNRLAVARRDLRSAIAKDPLNWDRWFDLALATRGPTQRHALERALSLNPHSPEIAEFVAGVGLKGIHVPSRQGG